MSINQNLYFIAVARISMNQAIIIGNFSYKTETDLNGVKKVLEQPNFQMQKGKHYTFTIGEVTWHLIQGSY